MRRWKQQVLQAFEQCNSKKVMQLLNSGFPCSALLTVRNSKGEVLEDKATLLHLACKYSFLEVVKYLIKAGVNLNAQDSYYRTPVMLACETGNLEVVKQLAGKPGIDLQSFDWSGNTALHICALNGHLALLKYFIEDLQLPSDLKNLHNKTLYEVCAESQNYTGQLTQVCSYLSALRNKPSKNLRPSKSTTFGISNLPPIKLSNKKSITKGFSVDKMLKFKCNLIYKNCTLTQRLPSFSRLRKQTSESLRSFKTRNYTANV